MTDILVEIINDRLIKKWWMVSIRCCYEKNQNKWGDIMNYLDDYVENETLLNNNLYYHTFDNSCLESTYK